MLIFYPGAAQDYYNKATGCSVITVQTNVGTLVLNTSDARAVLQADNTLLVQSMSDDDILDAAWDLLCHKHGSDLSRSCKNAMIVHDGDDDDPAYLALG